MVFTYFSIYIISKAPILLYSKFEIRLYLSFQCCYLGLWLIFKSHLIVNVGTTINPCPSTCAEPSTEFINIIDILTLFPSLHNDYFKFSKFRPSLLPSASEGKVMFNFSEKNYCPQMASLNMTSRSSTICFFFSLLP